MPQEELGLIVERIKLIAKEEWIEVHIKTSGKWRVALRVETPNARYLFNRHEIVEEAGAIAMKFAPLVVCQ